MEDPKEGNHNVAVYVDYPNTQNTNYDNEILIKAIRDKYGKILKFNSYWAFGTLEDKGNPSSVQKSSYYLYKNNINFIPVSSVAGKSDKNPTDTKIVIDIMDDLYLNNHFDTYVIVTSDRDFIPIFKKLIEQGKKVIVVLPRDSYNLHQFCNKMDATVLKLNTLMRKYKKED